MCMLSINSYMTIGYIIGINRTYDNGQIRRTSNLHRCQTIIYIYRCSFIVN